MPEPEPKPAFLPTPLERLARSRLYLVTEAGADPATLGRLLDQALRGGTDLIQLRDKDADEESLLAAAPPFAPRPIATGHSF